MNYKKTTLLLSGALTVLLVFAVLVIYSFYRQNEQLRDSFPFLREGQRITYFDLVGADNEKISTNALNEGNPSLILVFKQPCSQCNDSLKLWERIVHILPDPVMTYGIILDRDEMVDFAGKSDLNFKLYAPVEPQEFKKQLHITMTLAQTIFYSGNRVVFLKAGDLTGDDFLTLMDKIKSVVNVKTGGAQ